MIRHACQGGGVPCRVSYGPASSPTARPHIVGGNVGPLPRAGERKSVTRWTGGQKSYEARSTAAKQSTDKALGKLAPSRELFFLAGSSPVPALRAECTSTQIGTNPVLAPSRGTACGGARRRYSAYSLILRYRVRSPMPSICAAFWRLPSTESSVARMRSFSTSPSVLPASA